MAAGLLKMGKLYFKNMDEEWESYPSDELQAITAEQVAIMDEFQFKIVCHLCNQPVSPEQIKVNLAKQSWSCKKCHAVNG